jgi:hypothetical protein
MWSHLEKKLNTILTDAFLALFKDNPDIKDKFFGNFHLEIGLKPAAGKKSRQTIVYFRPSLEGSINLTTFGFTEMAKCQIIVHVSVCHIYLFSKVSCFFWVFLHNFLVP